MMLIDTSVIVQLLRDTSGTAARNWRKLSGRTSVVLCPLTQLELLQGARDEDEWEQLESYLDGQEYVDLRPNVWRDGARVFYELRRKGKTVRSVIDCVIAQVAIENKFILGHSDRDFEAICSVRPSLRQKRIDLLS